MPCGYWNSPKNRQTSLCYLISKQVRFIFGVQNFLFFSLAVSNFVQVIRSKGIPLFTTILFDKTISVISNSMTWVRYMSPFHGRISTWAKRDTCWSTHKHTNININNGIESISSFVNWPIYEACFPSFVYSQFQYYCWTAHTCTCVIVISCTAYHGNFGWFEAFLMNFVFELIEVLQINAIKHLTIIACEFNGMLCTDSPD